MATFVGTGLYGVLGSAEIINSTIAKNSGGRTGGVVSESGQLSITNSTIRENRGSGIAAGNLQIQNTVVAKNYRYPGSPGRDCVGVILSLGNNVLEDPIGCTTNLQASDFTGLGEFVDTGEPGRAYYTVLPGSIVIDNGNAAACPRTDQLGHRRNGACDIGAIEFRAPSVVNHLVSFVPSTSSFKTSPDTAGCPTGFVGTFSFAARLTNTQSAPMSDLILTVSTLTNGNLLRNADEGPGGAGASITVAKAGDFSDGLFSAGESVDQAFTICLKNNNPFSFFVDVLGATDTTTELVSINQAGTGGANDTLGNFPDHTISANGRVVAFVSVVSNLAGNDTNNTLDVFTRDLQNRTTTLASVNQAGTGSGNAASGSPALSADGRFVAFASDASDLVKTSSGNCNIRGGGNVFVRDLQMGTTLLVSVDRTGKNCGNGGSVLPSISADGRFVAFLSNASDLVQNDVSGQQVYVRDLQTGTTRLASVNRAGTGGGNDASGTPRISADGRFVGFSSHASDLVPTDTNGTWDVFVRDRQLGTTTLVSVNQAGTDSGNDQSGSNPVPTGFVLSADGRFVAFESFATDLVTIPTSGIGDVFVRDLQTGVTTLVSVNLTGTHSGNGSFGSNAPAITADGRFVAFQSDEIDLTPWTGIGTLTYSCATCRRERPDW